MALSPEEQEFCGKVAQAARVGLAAFWGTVCEVLEGSDIDEEAVDRHSAKAFRELGDASHDAVLCYAIEAGLSPRPYAGPAGKIRGRRHLRLVREEDEA